MIPISREAAAARLAGNPWFARQSDPLRQALLEAGRVTALAKGRWAYGEGDGETGLCAVLAGALRLEAGVDDRVVLLSLLGPGAVFGQSVRFGGGPRLVTARAASDAVILKIADSALHQISQTDPTVWRAVVELIYGQLAEAVRFGAEALSLPPRARVMARLEAIAPPAATAGAPRTARVSQADLADMCGLSRKSVSGHLLALQALGRLALGYGRITLHAPARSPRRDETQPGAETAGPDR